MKTYLVEFNMERDEREDLFSRVYRKQRVVYRVDADTPEELQTQVNECLRLVNEDHKPSRIRSVNVAEE